MSEPEDDPEDPWALVARAADAAQPGEPSARCPIESCGQLIALTEHAMIKVHFAKTTDAKPCPASFAPFKPKT
jgi:hypothetical protein